MKRRGDSNWLLWGLIGVAILAFVWYSGGFREGFDPSQDSFAKGSPPNCPTGSIAQSNGTCAGACPSGSTQNVISDGSYVYVHCDTQTASGGTSSISAPTVPALSCSGGGVLFEGACYEACPSGQVLQDGGSRYGIICVPGTAPSVPSPAASPSTQPMTVGIPTPCRPQYTSIPGGSMEFKCFN